MNSGVADEEWSRKDIMSGKSEVERMSGTAEMKSLPTERNFSGRN
jgi:hypothetical protein